MKSVKYDFAMLVAAGLLTGLLLPACSDGSEATPSGQPAPRPVLFSVTDTTAMTRAQGGVELSEVRSQGFGVFACNTGLYHYAASAAPSDFMYNQLVNWDTDHWQYAPVKYWPNRNGTDDRFVSFFGYAPYAAAPGKGSDRASQCVIELSLPDEQGGPWLVYRLGGTANDWEDSQCDLLAASDLDHTSLDKSVSLSFRHMLARTGDRVTVTSDVACRLEKITVDYELLPRARLLFTAEGPQWLAVAEREQMVVRTLTASPGASIGGGSSYVLSGHGIFVIPLGGVSQKATVTLVTSVPDETGPVTRIVTHDIDPSAGGSQDIAIHIPR